MNVYAFEFTDCYHESAFAVISLHSTKRGAFKAMLKYVHDRYYAERNRGLRKGEEVLFMERWRVRTIVVQEDLHLVKADFVRNRETMSKEIFERGECVGIFDMSKKQAEEACIEATEKTGDLYDWHYAMGRVVIKCLKMKEAA